METQRRTSKAPHISPDIHTFDIIMQHYNETMRFWWNKFLGRGVWSLYAYDIIMISQLFLCNKDKGTNDINLIKIFMPSVIVNILSFMSTDIKALKTKVVLMLIDRFAMKQCPRGCGGRAAENSCKHENTFKKLKKFPAEVCESGSSHNCIVLARSFPKLHLTLFPWNSTAYHFSIKKWEESCKFIKNSWKVHLRLWTYLFLCCTKKSESGEVRLS